MNAKLPVTPADQLVAEIEKLAIQLTAAERTLKDAQKHLDQIKTALIAKVGVKDEGTQSFHIHGATIKTVGKINRTLDEKLWDGIKTRIPAPLANRLVKYKPALDLKELRYVENNEPELWAVVASAITSKPAKPSVSVNWE